MPKVNEVDAVIDKAVHGIAAAFRRMGADKPGTHWTILSAKQRADEAAPKPHFDSPDQWLIRNGAIDIRFKVKSGDDPSAFLFTIDGLSQAREIELMSVRTATGAGSGVWEDRLPSLDTSHRSVIEIALLDGLMNLHKQSVDQAKAKKDKEEIAAWQNVIASL